MNTFYRIICTLLTAIIGLPAWALDEPDHGPLDPLPVEARHYREEDGVRHLLGTDAYAIVDEVLVIAGRDAEGVLQRERRFRAIARAWRCHADVSIEANGIRSGVEYQYDAAGRRVVMAVLRRDAAGTLLDDAEHRARNTYAYAYDDAGRLQRGPILGHMFDYTWDGESYEAVARVLKRYRVKRWSDPAFRREVREEHYDNHQFVYSWRERTEHLDKDGKVLVEVTAGVGSTFSRESPGTAANRGVATYLQRSNRIWHGPRLFANVTTVHGTRSLPGNPQATVWADTTVSEYAYPP